MNAAVAASVRDKAAGVSLLVLDVDGVLTDGRIALSADGEEIKRFHTRDGLGLKGLMQNGIAVALISARQSPLVAARARELGIDQVVQGREDKSRALDEVLASLELTAEAAAYVGDDLVDWPAMRRCRLKCAPADADDWIRERADYVAQRRGGHGAVREISELILAAHGRLEDWRAGFA